METKVEVYTAINTLTAKITSGVTAHEALQFTQAALNLAHVSAVLQQAAQKSP